MTAPEKRRLTAEEFSAMTFGEGERAELIGGEIVMQATPGITHQKIAARLYAGFDSFIRAGKEKCEPMLSVDVRLDSETNVVPDFLVMCDSGKYDEKRCYGAPDFVAEIVSGNRYIDFFKKLELYKRAGVREYWIIDPKFKKTTVYCFAESDYPEIYPFEKGIPVSIYGGKLTLNISSLIK